MIQWPKVSATYTYIYIYGEKKELQSNDETVMKSTPKSKLEKEILALNLY